MGLLDNLLQNGELPKIHTVVEIDNDSLVRFGLAIVLTATIIILINRVAKKV